MLLISSRMAQSASSATAVRNSHSSSREEAKRHVARYVLDEDPALEDFLNLPDAFSDVPHRLFGVRQREQVMQIAATHASPAQMVRNPRRLETTCGAAQR